MKLNDTEKRVLRALAEEWNEEMNCYYFRTIATTVNESGNPKVDLKIVRRACRSLRRKGLAEYQRGLFNDDGEVAGSGYCATRAGAELIAGLDAQKELK